MDIKNGLKNTKKKYKMVSITYTNDCLKNPRCSFCYLNRHDLLNKIGGINEEFNIHDHDKILQNTEQVAIAFNGIYLFKLIRIFDKLHQFDNLKINLTTNPEFLNEGLIAIFKKFGKVKMVALSLDPEKGSIGNWLKWAKKLKKKKIKVGANILMLDSVYRILPKILDSVFSVSDQIHLLRPKFYKSKIPLEVRRNLIFLQTQKYKNIFIDECFKNEFLGVPCGRGKTFVSINANNQVTPCSFDLYPDKKRVKICPYI